MLSKASKKFSSLDDSSNLIKKFISDWTVLMRCSTIEKYDELRIQLQNDWNKTEEGKKVVKHVEKWYLSEKEICIRAWTDQNLHLGNHANSHVEGAHAALKKYLKGSVNDLYIVFEAMERNMIDQHAAVAKALSD